MSIFDELKRRNVFRVGVAYIVAAWVFLQVADLVFDAINAPDWVLQSMLFLAVLGFIIAMIVAWAYEVTPEGIKREKEVVRDESITHQTAARLNKLTISLVLAGVTVVAVDRMIPEKEKGSGSITAEPVAQSSNTAGSVVIEPDPVVLTPDESSVAVLPFVNMSSDPEQEYFSDGISEEILNVLTRIPNLKVAARTSSFQFKGQTLDVADIARQLKVNHVLEGSVRKAGDQLRITAQLIEADSGYHLWSDTYDRKLEDVFAIQDEIAAAIAGELKARLGSSALPATHSVDLQAYEFYLKGRSLVASRKEGELFEAFDLLLEAIEIEPEYVAAMSTLAKAYVVAPYFSTRLSVFEFRNQGRQWADRALDLEPDNVEALAVKAIIINEQDNDMAGALSLLRKAIAINPGDVAVNNFLGDVLFRVGAFDEAVIYESRAVETDPLAPVHLSDLGHVLVTAGDYDRALELADRGLSLNPSFWNSHQNRFESHWALGNLELFEAAIRNTMDSINLSETDRLPLKAKVDMARGDVEAARQKVKLLSEAVNEGRYDPVDLAFMAVQVEDFDTAGEMLLRGLDEHDGTWMFPIYVRLPEQAPDSEPWQEFWSHPGPSRVAEIRRANGMNPHYPGFGEAAK